MLYATAEYNCMHYKLFRDGQLYTVQVLDDNEQVTGHCKGYAATGHLNGAKIPVMALGALSTEPEYRRLGMARQCFSMLEQAIEEDHCLISYLHPFSFDYYRTMGYERVSDHRMLEFPIRTLEFLPRYSALKRIRSTDDPHPIDEVYNRFAENRNIMFRREGSTATLEPRFIEAYMYPGQSFCYDCKNSHHYLSMDQNGQYDGYIALHKEMHAEHHYLFGTMYINALCFTSPEALRKLLGFVRMFDGEVDNVVIRNCGMAPEVERMLRSYKYTKVTVIPDLSARVHDVGGVLAAVKYPKDKGCFTLQITDSDKSPFSKAKTEGVWQVVYENGEGHVTRLEDDAPYDLGLSIGAFTQLIHGFESYGVELARYTQGVELINACPDFFRAFPNRPCGLYDLF